jgi:predicted GNAT superfamily acetyltransferase
VRLGVFAREYRIDMYGQTDSPLHQGIGTDRLIAIWPIALTRKSPKLQDAVQIEVPLDIHDINARDPKDARAWRERTRAAFTKWLQQGYVVVDFVREDARGVYLLVAPSDFEM